MARIIIAEDSPYHQELLRTLLAERDELSLHFYADGLEAYAAVLQERPDLLILDIMVPSLTGIAIAKLLKRHEDYRDIPILMMSSNFDANIRERVQKGGANVYLPKPYQPEQLLEALNSLLAAEVAR